ncbi:hypothetical protein [Salinispora pacifica]|uniref:hypothetical protein n=1 Tax=Salinispora pacifica TaxID=351187 RepID=UPI0003652145|nr:hypothetical protein [Salinispora pacifica]
MAAVRAGATHVIIGRSLTRAADPAAVLAHLTDERLRQRRLGPGQLRVARRRVGEGPQVLIQ